MSAPGDCVTLRVEADCIVIADNPFFGSQFSEAVPRRCAWKSIHQRHVTPPHDARVGPNRLQGRQAPRQCGAEGAPGVGGDAMPALDRITIEGFKSIRRLDLRLGRINVLIGPNGSGKSNVFGAMALLRATLRDDSELDAHVATLGRSGQDPALWSQEHRENQFRDQNFARVSTVYRQELIAVAGDRLVARSSPVMGDENWNYHQSRRLSYPSVPLLPFSGYGSVVSDEENGRSARQPPSEDGWDRTSPPFYISCAGSTPTPTA